MPRVRVIFFWEGSEPTRLRVGAAVVLAARLFNAVAKRPPRRRSLPSLVWRRLSRLPVCFCRAPPFRPFRAAEVSHGPESKTRGWRLSGSRSHAATRAFKIAADRLKLWSGGADKVDATGRQLLISWDGTLHNHVNACANRYRLNGPFSRCGALKFTTSINTP